MAARFVLCFLATFNILVMSLFNRAKRGPLVGGSQDCRKVLMRVRGEVPGGAVALMMRSMTLAHEGRMGEKFRYAFSHMISIASFRALMSSRLRPPSSIGLYRVSRAILGEKSLSQRKSHMILTNGFLNIRWHALCFSQELCEAANYRLDDQSSAIKGWSGFSPSLQCLVDFVKDGFPGCKVIDVVSNPGAKRSHGVTVCCNSYLVL